jgi:hypothetical protein
MGILDAFKSLSSRSKRKAKEEEEERHDQYKASMKCLNCKKEYCFTQYCSEKCKTEAESKPKNCVVCNAPIYFYASDSWTDISQADGVIRPVCSRCYKNDTNDVRSDPKKFITEYFDE